jgi:hypothetical protein
MTGRGSYSFESEICERRPLEVIPEYDGPGFSDQQIHYAFRIESRGRDYESAIRNA